MTDVFKEKSAAELNENPFELIGKEWMLVTAGKPDDFNTMTASWGGLGVMWNRYIAFCMIRPTRYTYEFINRSPRFTLSFFNEEYREALNFCGTHSGRDFDKVDETGLTPVHEGGAVWFREARLVLVCKKLYTGDIDPSRFLDPRVEDFYPERDYHRIYFGEIERCLVRN